MKIHKELKIFLIAEIVIFLVYITQIPNPVIWVINLVHPTQSYLPAHPISFFAFLLMTVVLFIFFLVWLWFYKNS